VSGVSERSFTLRVDISIVETADYRNSLRISEEAVVDELMFDQLGEIMTQFHDVVAMVKAHYSRADKEKLQSGSEERT
jgi:hypothetical protein